MPRAHHCTSVHGAPPAVGSRALLLLCLLAAALGACGTAASGAGGEPRQTVLLSEFSYGGDTDAFLHVLDGRDLGPIARIAARDPHTGVQPVPGGEKLLAAEGLDAGASGCCALTLLDLAAGTRCQLHEPLSGYVPSADGALGYSQRGNTPISIFDLASASRVGAIPSGAATFELSPSPDGRWLAAASRFSLDGRQEVVFYDAQRHERAGSRAVHLVGLTWQDGLLRGLSHQDDGWRLLSLRPPDGELVSERSLDDLGIHVPAEAGLALGAAGEALFVYVMLSDWMKLQDRRHVGADAPGGVFLLDADPGQAARHLLPEQDLGSVAASEDGSRLYALVARHDAPRLLALETATGDLLAERDLLDLGPGRWGLAAAELSASALAVTGDRRLGPCPHSVAGSSHPSTGSDAVSRANRAWTGG